MFTVLRRRTSASLFLTSFFIGLAAPTVSASPVEEAGPLRIDALGDGRFHFKGIIGDRIQANLTHWLLSAPDANPGMIEMFRVRDRKPPPQIVPWSGEFVGKYLISAIQALRMTDSPELVATVRRVIDELIATQADDGYLGPFQKHERLLGHWDLWGHYHVMLALMMYQDDAGYAAAMEAVIGAADLICETYLDGNRRAWDAGSQEMNLAVIHALGRLYRKTGKGRYLEMVRQIEKDWERAGDYFRQGLAGVDFYRTPRPRWESLHDIQGLIELFRITGNPDYKTAFMHLWTSITQLDRHNTGGFSSGEAAIGHPYDPSAIETCCTTAWMALSVDMLRLTGDSRAADELEWSTFNSMMGSQHPTGRWWTYNTPMDGKRQASAHTIVFQSRSGTPELNCCSVNAPRGLGMLSEWAVMKDEDGPLVNYYGPCQVDVRLPEGNALTLTQKTDYPASGAIALSTQLNEPATFNLRLRIPSWSTTTSVRVNGEEVPTVRPGGYLSIDRRWTGGETIDIVLDMTPRYWAGEREADGKASIYRGPVLLAFDQHFNPYDCREVPTIDLTKLDLREVSVKDRFPPMEIFDLKAADGRTVRLCDFATAGAHGTEYRSWLPAKNGRPPTFYLRSPRNGEAIAKGVAKFEWTGHPSPASASATFDLLVDEGEDFRSPLLVKTNLRKTRVLLNEGFKPGGVYFWKVMARNDAGATECDSGPWRFTVDPWLENAIRREDYVLGFGPEEIITASSLEGNADSGPRQPTSVMGIQPAVDRHGSPEGAVEFNGIDGKIQYKIPEFPNETCTVRAWIRVNAFAKKQYQQIFSAWCRGGDDPLRVSIMGETIAARIEAGGVYSTPGVPLELNRWTHVAAVKAGDKLRLYMDGQLKHEVDVPAYTPTTTRQVAIGANPLFSGDEYFHGRMDDFAFQAKALSDEQIREIYEGSRAK